MDDLIAIRMKLALQQPTKLTPLTELPAFLGSGGTAASKLVSPIAHDASTYRSLERLAALPPVRKTSKIQNEKVRQAYNKMCNGDFYVRWEANENEGCMAVGA